MKSGYRLTTKSSGDTINGFLCMLKPLKTEHGRIYLTAGKNIVGRSKESGIRDIRCSKQQLQLDVPLNRSSVKLKVLGLNPSAVNGVMVLQHTECELLNGDIIDVVYDGPNRFELIFRTNSNDAVETEMMGDIALCEENVTMEKWDSVGNNQMIVFSSAGVKSTPKIAAYDVDGTIIKTKSGNVFPKNTFDWQIIYPEVPTRLQRLYKDGYKICFFTNQGGIARGKVNLDDFKQKIKDIVKKLGIPIQIFIAIASGYFRKPLPGMWEYLRKEKNDDIPLEMEKCFFVGDAAGRPESGAGINKRRKDHSLADRLFAANIGISFYTPEEHFLGRRAEQWTKPDFDPTSLHEQVPTFDSDIKIPAESCEIIVMVGLPGSGKSFFCQQQLLPLGYTIANADSLGSIKACIKVCEDAISCGKSCVVDNTNVDMESRKKFVDLASKFGITCRCFVMNVTLAHVKHNIAYRELANESHAKVNEMVLNMMKKKYKSPTIDEGFTEIAKVNLKPNFNDNNKEKIYKLYLVEK